MKAGTGKNYIALRWKAPFCHEKYINRLNPKEIFSTLLRYTIFNVSSFIRNLMVA